MNMENANYDGRFETLCEILAAQKGNYDLGLIRKAYDTSRTAHGGQKRLSGEPFFFHPFSVACIVAKLGMDDESIAAALLHDSVEDTEVTLDGLKKEFGESVAMLVDGVTKLGKVAYSTREQQQAENIRKMLLAMAQDIRVIVIKLADRLHNMRTIDAQTSNKQLEKSLETLEIYAPIAHRLGIRAVKEELEDLAIAHLDPVAYREIEQALEENREYRTQFIENIKSKIKERLGDSIPNLLIEGRVKSIHGIYRKMYVQGKQFEEIYDIYAVRVIVNTVTDCYNVLGLIHEMFRPIPGRFKDYISTPKSNMYQSLHTTVISRQGAPFEVQIRTWDMHHTAEYGIAAHWKYKDGINRRDERFEERLSWIRQLLENQKEADDVEEIVRTIKTDLAPEDVFGVTPNGDVISLPVGSTVIDFAYAIHSAVGNRMVGAKVDGRIVPIDHQIATGEVIEIITSSQQGKGPSRDWLKIVKTSEARNKIRAWFKKERRAENIEQGRSEVEKEFKRNGINLPDDEMQVFLSETAQRQHCQSTEDFYNKIGYGGIILSRIMPRIKDDYSKIAKTVQPIDIAEFMQEQKPAKKSPEGVVIEGIDNCLIKLSRCCNPIPGDNIIGFITRGHGVSVHKRDCTNVPKDIASCDEPDRWVRAHWGENHQESFNSTIQVLAFDRAGLLADITVAIANMRVMIHAVNAREMKDGNYCIEITVRIESLEHLRSIVNNLSKINGVYSVERSIG
jgi:guanosine-3',5'-bis(diphosphate) 3'-pyrophosphohydrolase